MPGISIIIPTYNRENFIKEAIESVISQECVDDVEIIISDDGSIDNTLKIAESFDERVVVLRKPFDCKTQGAASTRNRGILSSTKKFICFLDSDDYYLPGHLKRMITLLNNNPEIQFGFCRVMEKIELNNIMVFKPWTKKNIRLRDIRYPVVAGNNIICTNSFIFRREVFERIGLFNEALSNGEDADMWMRISEQFRGGFSNHFGAVRRKHGQNQLTFNPGMKIRQDHFQVYKSALKRCYNSIKKDRYRIFRLQLRIIKYQFYNIGLIQYLDSFFFSLRNWYNNRTFYYKSTQIQVSENWNEISKYIETSDLDVKFIINTATNWSEPPRARHQVTRTLAKKHKVVFVAANKVGWPKMEITKTSDNVIVFQPYYYFDYRIRYRVPLLNEVFQIWLFKKLRKMIGEVDVINFDFSSHLIHNYFPKVIYYCNDNFVSISKKLNIWPIYLYHASCERRLALKSAFCIGTSSIIVTKLKQHNPHSFEILLGGPNIEDFNIAPLEKKDNDGPINIGLVGFIRNYNLSYRMINNILEKINCIITLIGPVEPDFYNHIVDPSRIMVKGILTDLPLLEAVNQFDVAIAPYLDRKIEEGGMPNKLFIYLALGKPVVMTELLSLKQMELPDNMIYLVKDSEEFPNIIKRAHYENNWELIQDRVKYAKLNTWDNRINHFMNIYNEHTSKINL